jgi:hypothetical protein
MKNAKKSIILESSRKRVYGLFKTLIVTYWFYFWFVNVLLSFGVV